MEPTDNKLLDQVRACRELVEGTPSASRAFAGQCKHYSIRTEEAYANWIKRYIYFHSVRHPAEMGAAEVKEAYWAGHFLSLLMRCRPGSTTTNASLSSSSE